MFKARQLTPAAANICEHAFSWGMYLGEELIAYASGKNVVVYYRNSFTHLLTGHTDDITCVEVCASTGKLVACCKGKMYFYVPEKHNKDPRKSAATTRIKWKLTQTVEIPDYTFEFVSWNLFGDRILVGGKETMIFDLDQSDKVWKKTWSFVNPTPVFTGKISPFDKYFVTVAKNDRMPKVWYLNKIEDGKEEYSYLYLPHPRAVTRVDWRCKEFETKGFICNVLMTTCADNTIRIWTETHKSEELQFHVVFAQHFDSPHIVRWLNRTHELCPNELILEYLKKKYKRKEIEGGHKDLTKWNEDEVLPEDNLIRMVETHSWIIDIAPDGGVYIKLIQGLSDFPRRTPICTMWAQLSNIFDKIEDPLKLEMYFQDKPSDQLGLGHQPAKLIFYVLTKQGAILSYELLLGKNILTPSLELGHIYTGHKKPVSQLSSHLTRPLVASLDPQQKQVIIWHVRDTPQKDILTNIKPCVVDASAISWFVSESSLFVSTDEGIQILHVKSADPEKHTLELDEVTMYPPLPSFYTHEYLDIVLERSEDFAKCNYLKSVPSVEPNVSIVVAIDASNLKIGIWKVKERVESDTGKPDYESEVLFIQDFDSSIDITCVDCEKVFWNDKLENKDEDTIVLAVGCENGDIIIYKIGKKKENSQTKKIGGLMNKFSTFGDNKLEMREWTRFKADNDAIGHVRVCDLYSRLFACKKDGTEMKIFEAESQTTFSLEEVIKMSEGEIIKDCSWCSYRNGKYVLLIATNMRVQSWTQGIVDYQIGSERKNKSYWTKIADLMSATTDESCNAVCVTKDRSIVAAYGPVLHVYPKWSHEEGDRRITLATKTLLLHRRLPNYHPRLLTDLLTNGQFKLVTDVFIHLAKALRDDKKDAFDEEIYIPGMSITHILQKKEETSKKRTTLLDRYSFLDVKDDEEKSEENDEMTFAEAHKILTEKLTSITLPYLSRKDQINLMALADTLSHITQKPDALDDKAIRYLVATKIHQFLLKTRKDLKNITLNSAYVAWAMQSETQEALLQFVLPQNTLLTWKMVKELGIIYWVTNPILLKNVVERLAKDIFTENNDPTACALLFMALKKKSALVRLFKAKDNLKLANFFGREYKDAKSKSAASRNAFILMGRHQFEYAAAFFLLADNIKDALEMLIDKAHDYELAYLIARLYTGDYSESSKYVLREYLLPKAKKLKDKWLESIVLWRLQEYEESIKALVVSDFDIKTRKQNAVFDPSLYAYCMHVSTLPQTQNSNLISENRESIILRTAHYYTQTGNILMAIDTLTKLHDKSNERKVRVKNQKQSDQISSGLLDMSAFGAFGGFGEFGGFGGFGMQQTTTQTTQETKKEEDVNEDMEIEREELTKIMTFKFALNVMTQELYDAKIAANASIDEEWDRIRTIIFNGINDLVKQFDIDKKLLMARLKLYCKINWRVLGRCLLVDDANEFLQILDATTQQIILTLPLLLEKPLSPAQVSDLERITNEFVVCYERYLSQNYPISESKKTDFAMTIYISLFIAAWCKRDFKSLYLLFTIQKKLIPDQKDKRIKRFYFALKEPIKFYKSIKAELAKQQKEEQLLDEIEMEEKKYNNLAYFGISSKKETKKAEPVDPYLETLETEHNWGLLDALIIYKFLSNVRYFCDIAGEQAIEESSIITITTCSMLAETTLSCLTLWSGNVQSKLRYKEMEIYNAFKSKFKENSDEASRFINTQPLLQPQIFRNFNSEMHNKNFYSLVHAIPELGLEDPHISNIISTSSIAKWSETVSTFKEDAQCQELWNYLVNQNSTVEFFSLTSQKEEALSVAVSMDLVDEEKVQFSQEIEIVKTKEAIKSFCINKEHPNFLAFGTSKLIREINIEHSIRFRKRDPSLETLLDEEMPTWETALYKFDTIATRYSNDNIQAHTRVNLSHIPRTTSYEASDWISSSPQLDEIPRIDPSRFIGIGNKQQKKLRRVVTKTKNLLRLSITNRNRANSITKSSPIQPKHFSESSTTEKKPITHDQTVNKLISHPYLPFYLSGGYDGAIYLWQFGYPNALRAYRKPGTSPITSIRFTNFGYKFGATDTDGVLSLWRFEATRDSLRPFESLTCHSKANDFTFLDSASVIATIGITSTSKQLCLWDILLPTHEACIHTETFEQEPTCLLYSPRHHQIYIGEKKGDLKIFDFRKRKIMKSIKGEHTGAITCLTTDVAEDFFISSCGDGIIKVWDSKTFNCISNLKKSKTAITDMDITGTFLYYSDASGKVYRRTTM